MKIKIAKHDKVFSKLVRERVNYVCEHSGLDLRHEPGKIECAHIMGRRGVGLRWHPANAIALSKKSHLYFTQHPFDFRDWCVDYLGEDVVCDLRREASKPVHWKASDKESIYAHLKAEYDAMLTRRAMGEMGRIDFARHELMAAIGN